MSAPRLVLHRPLCSGAVALSLAAVVVLTGCGTEPADPDAPSTSTSTSAAAATPTTSPSASASAPVSASASATPTAAADVVIDINLADGRTQPSGKKIDVTKGQTVRLNITADHDDAVHVHGDYDLDVEVSPGKSVSKSFVADSTGSVEVESHHPEKIIAILNIR